jgi:hypothetical protein
MSTGNLTLTKASNVLIFNSVSGISEKKNERHEENNNSRKGEKNEQRNYVKESIGTLLRRVLGHTVTSAYKEMYVSVIAVMNIKL